VLVSVGDVKGEMGQEVQGGEFKEVAVSGEKSHPIPIIGETGKGDRGAKSVRESSDESLPILGRERLGGMDVEPGVGPAHQIGCGVVGENAKGFVPTLVGGMALVAMGSKRVTQDFDFLLSERAREERVCLEVIYKHGFELISKLDGQGEVVRTINNLNVASARLRIDQPKSAFFYHPISRLRVDLLFDFPMLAGDVLRRASSKKIRSFLFRIADKEDLIKMKEIAARDRQFAGDVQDLEFLRRL
jgi:hypothetical protein